MFNSNKKQLESTIANQEAEIASLKSALATAEEEKRRLKNTIASSDNTQVLNELIKSLTQGLTDSCGRDLSILQSDLSQNVNHLEDINARNHKNAEFANACDLEIEQLISTLNQLLEHISSTYTHEMVYLVVTDYNEECIEWIIDQHLKMLGPEVPLHINRYYPAHRWHKPPTPTNLLLEFAERARRAGIEYVYVGNIGDPSLETTRCPNCGKTLIVRNNYRVVEWNLVEENGRYRCPRCNKPIPIHGKFAGWKNASFKEWL